MVDQRHLISANSAEQLRHEYFHLVDERQRGFSHKGAYDDNPERTKKLELHYQQRMQTSEWRHDISQEGGLYSLRFKIGELPSTVAFRRTAPKAPLRHHEYIELRSPALVIGKGRQAYQVVSPAWRDAVEAVEPAIHEFHSIRIVFLDAAIERFIFRPMQFIDAINLEKSDAEIIDGKARGLLWPPSFITLREIAVRNKHYICCNTHIPFISIRLAELLKPLLPGGVFLQPVSVE